METAHFAAWIVVGIWTVGLTVGLKWLSRPFMQRWMVVWGGVSCLFIYFLFMNRHFLPRSMLLELPAAVLYGMTMHMIIIFHPQLADLERRSKQAKYAGTAHLGKLRHCKAQLEVRESQLKKAVLLLAWTVLALVGTYK